MIARMDADDVMLRDRLERQLAYLDAHPDVALLGGGIVLIDESGAEIDREPGRVELDFLARNELTHATVAMRTEVFRELHGYRLDQAEDYDLWLRFEERGGVAALPDFVLRYRLHPGQFSVTALERQALGFLCVRAAAIARRRGESDPLAGVERLDESLLERLGITRSALGGTVVSDAVQWAATLGRVGREDEAAVLLDAAAAVPGAPGRAALGAAGARARAEARSPARPPRRRRTRARGVRSRPMTLSILQVNASDSGGGAETVGLELHRAYRGRGLEATLAVGLKRTSEPGVVAIGEHRTLRERALRDPRVAYDVLRGREDFRHPASHRVLELAAHPPDVLHLHNLTAATSTWRLCPCSPPGGRRL